MVDRELVADAYRVYAYFRWVDDFIDANIGSKSEKVAFLNRQQSLLDACYRQDVYMGLSPFEAPATFSMMPYTELAHGVWYPKGGMYRIVETLFSLAVDYRQNFTTIINDLSLPANPSLYIHAPARLDPAMAPPGQDTLIAIVPVGHMSENGDQNWSALRDQARKQVFRRLTTLGITDLEEHIKFETTFTPLSWQKRYNLAKGATHILCHNLTQLGYLRPSNRRPHYYNLYFAGASTHPGTGLPTALVSGRLTAQRIMDENA